MITISNMIHHLDSTDFDDVISAVPLAVVDFYAPWCLPCKQLGKTLETLDTDVPVFKVDIDSDPTLGERFDVRSIPTLVLFKDGNPVNVTTGAQTASMLRQFING